MKKLFVWQEYHSNGYNKVLEGLFFADSKEIVIEHILKKCNWNNYTGTERERIINELNKQVEEVVVL